VVAKFDKNGVELPAQRSVHAEIGAEDTAQTQSEEDTMPAKSKAQQKAAGAALSAKRGETPLSKLKGASRSMADSMSEKQLEEFAHTKRKALPDHKSKSK
jgi:hypothetical protein